MSTPTQHPDTEPDLPSGFETTLFDPSAPLVASGNLRRRKVVNRFAEGSALVCALAAIFVLGLIVEKVIVEGGGAISWDFLTKNPPQFGGPGGGMAPAIVGTAFIVAVGALIAVPIGVLVALYVTEFAGKRMGSVIRLAVDLLNGLPSIVIGLFVFGLMVSGHHQSGFAGSVALGILMLPLIARATQEMLRAVPSQLREAAAALGVARWRAVVGVILPAAMSGIVTGAVLAIARAAGETAPLILVDSIFGNKVEFNAFGVSIPNIPVSIFSLSEAGDPDSYKKAWGLALVLLVVILLANITARTLLARSRKKNA
jgi:phosphate transport system permease protein